VRVPSFWTVILTVGATLVAAVLVLQVLTTGGLPDPTPSWMGLWFAVFPTVETLAAQALAAFVVVGSYFLAREQVTQTPARIA
jgi:hypothetical protein